LFATFSDLAFIAEGDEADTNAKDSGTTGVVNIEIIGGSGNNAGM